MGAIWMVNARNRETAQLMETAPELLAVVEQFVAWTVTWHGQENTLMALFPLSVILQDANAAIAKAKGGE